MQENNDGGAAFPVISSLGETYGMSLRDYFAAAALTGFTSDQGHTTWVKARAAIEGMKPEQFTAEACYEMADAMITARKQEKANE
jgi:hypothetical protein